MNDAKHRETGTRPFVIWSYAFTDTSGGIIALHLLCKRLNDMGERALIWEAGRPAFRNAFGLGQWVLLVRSRLGRLRRLFQNNPFNNPLARRRDLDGAIVVYPEIVPGDPLGGGKAVRWLLHSPGFHKGKAVFGSDDLFFFYQEAFNDPGLNADPTNRLTLTWFIDDYQQRNHGERSGSAYLLRKGKGRPISHDLADSVCVDDMSHAERAAVFNRVKYFYSYDLYSMYALYAAMCGCIPIVVPDPAMTKQQWTPDERDTLGIAYGVEDVPWAIETRGKLLEKLTSVREGQDMLLRAFIRKCRAAFPDGAGG